MAGLEKPSRLEGIGYHIGFSLRYGLGLLPTLLLPVGLVRAFGYTSVKAVVGHDYGASVAVWCAITRPDVFRSLVFMSAPFGTICPSISGQVT